MLPSKLCGDGLPPEKLILSELKKVIDDIESREKLIGKTISMQEFLAQNKKVISSDKSHFLNLNIKITRLLQTLDQAQTLTEKGCSKSWTKLSKTVSEQLLFPTKIDLPDSDTIFSNGYVADSEPEFVLKKISHEMQNKNWQKTLLQLSQASQQEFMDREVTRSAKIRIYPTQKQKKKLSNYFGANRYFYNKAVDFLNKSYTARKEELKELGKNGCIKISEESQCGEERIDKTYFCQKHKNSKVSWNMKLTLPSLRKEVMTPNKNLTDDEMWQAKIPATTRSLAISKCISATKAAITNKKRGNIEQFQLSFKSKKDKRQCFHVDDRSVNLDGDLTLFKRKMKRKIKVKKKDKRSFKIKKECTFVKDNNRYYVCIPSSKKVYYAKSKYNTVALDPGIRTFQTFYSPDGVYGFLGKDTCKRTTKIGLKVDKLISILDKKETVNGKRITHRIKCNIKKLCLKLRTKIKNIIYDLHCKVSKYLCKNFENILLPSFDTKQMSKKNKFRQISNQSVRNMMYLSHYKFKQRLIDKAELMGRKVFIVNESYTSKACGFCGKINSTLKGKKVFKCKKCKLVIDRDVNGARNILMKFLIEKFM